MPDNASRTAKTLPTTETIELLANRVSVRKYADQAVSEEAVEAILRAAFRAPTSSNIQSYSVVVVRDPATLEQLCAVTGGQLHVKVAPVFLAFCADLTRIEGAMQRHDHTIQDNNLEIGLVSSIDASLVGMSASLVAESLGLKGVMIGAVRNNAAETARILGLPDGVFVVFGMVLGYPGETPPQKPRMDYSRMVHYESYGKLRDERAPEQALSDYDTALAAHYREDGRTTTDASWSDDMDKKFTPQLRENLRTEVKGRGFDFR